MTSSTLVLLRHGESQWNRENCSPDGQTCRRQGRRHAAGRVFTSIMRAVFTRSGGCLTVLTATALQGVNKNAAARLMGAETVRYWRKSFTSIPPADVEAPVLLRLDPQS